MVKGMDIFKKYFAEYENQYVLIGGAREKTTENLLIPVI